MKFESILRVACCVLVLSLLLVSLLLRNEICDAIAVISYPFRDELAKENLSLSLSRNAPLAVQCLAGDYDPEFVLEIAPPVSGWNPKRAEDLLNQALSQTMIGIKPRVRCDLLLVRSTIERMQKKFDDAEKSVRESMPEGKGPETADIDHAVLSRWELAEIAVDRKDFKKAQQYLDEAIDWQYAYLPNSPCMQNNLALLLEKKSDLKNLMKDQSGADILRKRAHAVRLAMELDQISSAEVPFIIAAHEKFEREAKKARVNLAKVAKTKSASLNSKLPSKVLDELGRIRFPAACLVSVGAIYSQDRADGIHYESSNVEERVTERTIFGPVNTTTELLEEGCYIANDKGETFAFNTQHGRAISFSGSQKQSLDFQTPQVWWGCRGLLIDPKNNTMLAISDDSNNATFFEKPVNSNEPWTAMASLGDQGVESPLFLFFGPDGALYTFETNTNTQLIGLSKMSRDGIIRSRYKFPQAVLTQFDGQRCGLVCTKDKIVIMQQREDGPGTIAKLVLDYKGNVLGSI